MMFQTGYMRRFARGLNPLSNDGKEYWQQEYHWHKQVESGMDKTKVAIMDMETFRQLKEAEDERDYWRRLARELLGIIKKLTKQGKQ